MSNLTFIFTVCLFVFGKTISAAEVETIPTKKTDWSKIERQLYQKNTLVLNGPQMIAAMPSVLSFSESAKHNVANELADEYKTIFERNALYDLISLVIEHDKNTKEKKRSVKFFHAATVVTARVPLGIVDIADDSVCAALTPEVRKFLRTVNADLLRHNMPIIKKLLLDWEYPRNPITEAEEVSGWDFDLAMVDHEQGKVEQIISAGNLNEETKKNLNVVSSGCNWVGELAIRYGTLIGEAQQWLENVGYSPFDFFNLEHRKAVGKALVTIFHKKTEEDFRKAIGK